MAPAVIRGRGWCWLLLAELVAFDVVRVAFEVRKG
jgi:hypothetical protein